jgi:hypothetical protein
MSALTADQVVRLREDIAGDTLVVLALCEQTRAKSVEQGDRAAAYEAWSYMQRAFTSCMESVANLDRLAARLRAEGT